LEKSRWIHVSTSLDKGHFEGGIEKTFPVVVTSAIPLDVITSPSTESGQLLSASLVLPSISRTDSP
jgi:hypothetical protein